MLGQETGGTQEKQTHCQKVSLCLVAHCLFSSVDSRGRFVERCFLYARLFLETVTAGLQA